MPQLSSYEIVFSQSPYNMKGLLMGAIYAKGSISISWTGHSVSIPSGLCVITAVSTCGSLYMSLLLALTVVCFIVYVLVARGYHKRMRDETKRQQDYTEDYYSASILAPDNTKCNAPL